MKIIIRFANYEVEAELLDTPTAQAIYNVLPLQEHVNRWGDEIYFRIPVQSQLESAAKDEVNEGDLAYWPAMPAFCIFFGPTPVSAGNKPRAASPVNVFGKIYPLDRKELQKIGDGEKVSLERAG
jgi:hypothetical protein